MELTRRARLRIGVGGLAVLAVVDVIDAVLAVGKYEHRITVVTHGSADLPLADFAYSLADYLLGDVRTARVVAWVLALAVAAAAFNAAGRPRLGRWTRGWLGAAAVCEMVSLVYMILAAPPDPLVDGVLTTRPVAYPVWTVSTAVMLVALHLAAGPIRRDAGEPARTG